MSSAQYTLRFAPDDVADSVHAFHEATLTPHLWPRKPGDFAKLAANQQLFFAESKASRAIVGACYVKHDDEDPQPEFGGICTQKAVRNGRIGFHLGAFAIASYLLANVEPGTECDLIAHVHSRNDDHPRTLLGFLGLDKVDSVTIPACDVPEGMVTETDGTIVGEVYLLRRPECVLAAITDILSGATAFELEPAPPELPWPQFLEGLREIAASWVRRA